MTTKVLWFVLAGFLLGFTVSTLWEWFHFRRERLKLTDRRIRELEDQLREREEAAAALPAPEVVAEPWPEPPYRSPGVFLETESLPPEPETLAPRVGPLPPDRVPMSEPVIPRPVAPRPPAVTEDPGRARRAEALAALRRTSEAKQRGSDAKPETKADAKAESPPAATRAVTELSFVPAAATPAVETAAAETAAVGPPAGGPSHWSQDPTLTRRAANHPDDLSKVRGIGDVYKQRLYRAGIFTWHQITEADTETLRRATTAHPSSNVEEWPEQARKLADKAGRGGAIYAGPLPDDFTKIYGIGPVGLQSLYRAGICTFEQLAVTPVEELAALFPIAVAGDQPDFAQWVAQATRLADAKHQS